MALIRNIVVAIAGVAASAGAGGAYFVSTSRATAPSAEPAHASVVLETQEAPPAAGASVQVDNAGKAKRVEVRRSGNGTRVQVDNGDKSERVEVERSPAKGEQVRTGNVRVERKGGGLNVKVGDLSVDTQGVGAD
ncbi:MAG: hypothetical protein IPI67_09060 [Myxococcales bacterium]|nr:hypothetical protein [Myxococcales bacterium]